MSKKKNKQKKDDIDDIFRTIDFALVQVYWNKNSINNYKLLFSRLYAGLDFEDLDDINYKQSAIMGRISDVIKVSDYEVVARNTSNSSEFKSEYESNRTIFNTFITEPGSGIKSRGQDSDTIFLKKKNSDHVDRLDIVTDWFRISNTDPYIIDKNGKISKNENILSDLIEDTDNIFAFNYRKHQCTYFNSIRHLTDKDMEIGFLTADLKSDKEAGARMFCNIIAPTKNSDSNHDFFIAKARYKAPDNDDSIAKGVVRVPEINANVDKFETVLASEMKIKNYVSPHKDDMPYAMKRMLEQADQDPDWFHD